MNTDTVERSTMQIMDATGHTEIKWNPDNPAEVTVARDMFTEMVGKGYSIFDVNPRNQQGKRITEFDPKAEKYMVVPQLRGG